MKDRLTIVTTRSSETDEIILRVKKRENGKMFFAILVWTEIEEGGNLIPIADRIHPESKVTMKRYD